MIDSEINFNNYVGNGATSTYTYTFKIFSENSLVLTVADTENIETALVLGVDYTVTGVGVTAGGTIILIDSSQDWLDGDGDLKTDYKLNIKRVRPLKQETDIRNQGPYFPEIHEDEFDRQIMIAQQQQEEIDRTIKLPTTTDDIDMELPSPVASALIGYNEEADGLTTYIADASAAALLAEKATGADVDAGTDNDKYVTPKAMADSAIGLFPTKATGAEVDTGTDDDKFVTCKALTDSAMSPTKATGAEVNTGTDDDKFVTAKAIKDSKVSYTDGAETLTNKTLTNPDINGGTLDGVQVGGIIATGELLINNAADEADGLGSQGTVGQRLTSAGVGALPTWEDVGAGSSLSNVIFCWSGIEGTVGNNGAYLGTSLGPTTLTHPVLILMNEGGVYKTILRFQFTKTVGISTTTIHARIWSHDVPDNKEALLRVDIGGQNNFVKSVTSTAPAWVPTTDIDISGLSDGTTYDGVIQLGNEDGGTPSYCSAITLIGS